MHYWLASWFKGILGIIDISDIIHSFDHDRVLFHSLLIVNQEISKITQIF